MRSIGIYLSWLRSLRSMRIGVLLLTGLFLATVSFNTPLLSAEQVAEQISTRPVETTNTSPTDTKKPVEKKTATKKIAGKKPASTTSSSSIAPASSTPAASTTPVAASTPTPAYDSVSIPSIGLSSRLVTVGVTATNAVDVHASLVGWYNGSARPGSNGASFLDGHNPGIFSNLPSIKKGDAITVKFASGESYTYKVVFKEIVRLVDVDMKKALSPYNSAAQGLNLMTCMGAYNPATGTTDKRLIVYAVR